MYYKLMMLVDNNKLLIFVHIGKCGGASALRAIKESSIINDNFDHVERVHVSKPPILRNGKYLFVIRNPIKRSISAFNWRYKLVVEEERQKMRFENEYQILKKYKTLNNLAESLYSDKVLNLKAAKEFKMIHHLNEDIAYYTSELLKNIEQKQIYGVLATETLGDDIFNIFGLNFVDKVHENRSKTSFEQNYLSKIAYANLMLFLKEDYAAIEKLLTMSESMHDARDVLLS